MPDFYGNLKILTNFNENPKYEISRISIRLVHTVLCGQIKILTDMKRIMVSFRVGFGKASKNWKCVCLLSKESKYESNDENTK